MTLFTRRRRIVRTDSATRAARFVGRYIVAAIMIPISVLVGILGLCQYWARRGRR